MKVISLPQIFQVLYVLCFTRPRYQVSIYRTIGPMLFFLIQFNVPFKIISLIETSQSIGGAKRE